MRRLTAVVLSLDELHEGGECHTPLYSFLGCARQATWEGIAQSPASAAEYTSPSRTAAKRAQRREGDFQQPSSGSQSLSSLKRENAWTLLCLTGSKAMRKMKTNFPALKTKTLGAIHLHWTNKWKMQKNLFQQIHYNTNNYYCAANIATNPLSKNNFNYVTSFAEKRTT